MYSLFVLSAFILLAKSETIFGGSAIKPYDVKKEWVSNFIKFQLVSEEKQKKPKIVPIGCAPSNTMEGELLKINETMKTREFVYTCIQGEDGVVSFEAIGCFADDNKLLKIGQARVRNNKTIIEQCGHNQFGAVVKSVEAAIGCFETKAIYFEDAEWVHKTNDTQDQNDMMDGIWMKCFRPHNGYYEAHVIGCASNKTLIKTAEYAELDDGKYVKCVDASKDNVTLVEVDKHELNCEYDGRQFEHGVSWIDQENGSELQCRNTVVEKTGCLIKDKIIAIGQEAVITLGAPNYCTFVCHPEANAYVCTKIIGDYELVEEPQNTNTTISSVTEVTETTDPDATTTTLPSDLGRVKSSIYNTLLIRKAARTLKPRTTTTTTPRSVIGAFRRFFKKKPFKIVDAGIKASV